LIDKRVVVPIGDWKTVENLIDKRVVVPIRDWKTVETLIDNVWVIFPTRVPGPFNLSRNFLYQIPKTI